MLHKFYVKKKFNIAPLEPLRLTDKVTYCQVTELFNQLYTTDRSTPSKC